MNPDTDDNADQSGDKSNFPPSEYNDGHSNCTFHGVLPLRATEFLLRLQKMDQRIRRIVLSGKYGCRLEEYCAELRRMIGYDIKYRRIHKLMPKFDEKFASMVSEKGEERAVEHLTYGLIIDLLAFDLFPYKQGDEWYVIGL